MPSFEDYKKEYKEARAEERKKLKLYMDPFIKTKGHFLYGYVAEFGGNFGNSKSNFKGNLVKDYDLSNYMWLTFVKSEDNYKKYLTIYFQSSTYYEKNKNHLTLFDRLSYDFSIEKVGYLGKYETVYKSEMFITDIDLPLTRSSMKRLLKKIAKKI